MCINENGVCLFCGRDYKSPALSGKKCGSDDCPSRNDLVAALTNENGIEPFRIIVDENKFIAKFPEIVDEWDRTFNDRQSCKNYLVKMVCCLILWGELSDVSIDTDLDDCIDEPFYQFEIGTDRLEIWHWFEDTFQVSIGNTLNYISSPRINVFVGPLIFIEFENYRYTQGSELFKFVTADFFSDANGYEPVDLQLAKALKVGDRIMLDTGGQTLRLIAE